MQPISHRSSRVLRSPEAGFSLADALVALVILVLALSVAAAPIVVATMKARSLAAETSETLGGRQTALEGHSRP